MDRVVYVTTFRRGVSAEDIRVRYFKSELSRRGFRVESYRVRVPGYTKYLQYLLLKPPRRLVELSRGSLVIATVPPIINAIYAYKAAREAGSPLVVDIRDIWEEYAETKWRIVSALGILDHLRRRYYEALGYASAITVTTPEMREYYRERLGDSRIHVVYNGTDPSTIACSDKAGRTVDLVYLGNFNDPNQALEFLLDTLVHNSLSLIVVGGGRLLKGLKKRASRNKLGDRAVFVGEVGFRDLPKHLCRARVGVVGRPFIQNPQYLYTVPVKIYDYLAAGLPVAGYGPPGSAYGRFIVSRKLGVYVSARDTRLFSEKLVELVERSDEIRGLARSTSLEFDRRRWARVFADIVESVFGAGS